MDLPAPGARCRLSVMSAALVITTFPHLEPARSAIRAIVAERLAACGTIIPGAESIYTWKGKIETARETMVLFKTLRSSYPALEQRLRQIHPFETPEIIAIDISTGANGYLDWIAEWCAVAPGVTRE